MFRARISSLMVATVAAFVMILAGATSASAFVHPNDPVKGAGCASGGIHHNWGNNGYPTYQYTLNLSWCWSTGGSTSQITNIRGSGDSSSTTIFQTQNASGPQTSGHIPILASDTFGNVTTVYGWFQSRDCLTGGMGLVCSTWTWHRSTVQLTYGGGLNYLAQT